MTDALKAVDKIIDAVDDNVYSEQESQAERTERLRLDMQSDNWLAKSIRPLITLYTGLIWGVSVVLWFILWFINGIEFAANNWEVLVVTAGPFLTCIGFYFHSRRQEKITAKKTDAAIKIEALKTKHELREEKRDNRAERRKD